MPDRHRFFEFRLLKPSFAARRLLSVPAFDVGQYAEFDLSPEEKTKLRGVAQTAGTDFPRRELLFVFGPMPRSGTNFLFEMLLTHPRFARARIPLDEFGVLAAPEAFEAPRRTIGHFHPPSGQAFARLEWMAYGLAGFRNRLLSLAADDTVTLVKEPHVYHLELLPVMFPRDRCIVLLRNARYIADSYHRTFGGRSFGRTFEEICLETAAAVAKTLAFLERTPPDYVQLVRYEEAAHHRQATMTKILSWLGEEICAEDMAGLERIPVLGSSTHSRDAEGRVSWEPRKADANFDPVSRPLDWTRAQEAIFERTCAATNRRAGY